jgi:hypothetical protein
MRPYNDLSKVFQSAVTDRKTSRLLLIGICVFAATFSVVGGNFYVTSGQATAHVQRVPVNANQVLRCAKPPLHRHPGLNNACLKPMCSIESLAGTH